MVTTLDSFKCFLLICVVLSLEAKTIQNQEELDDGLDSEPNDWSHLNWDSIFNESARSSNNCARKLVDTEFINSPLKSVDNNEKCMENPENKKLISQNENKIEDLSKDEVFPVENVNIDLDLTKHSKVQSIAPVASEDSVKILNEQSLKELPNQQIDTPDENVSESPVNEQSLHVGDSQSMNRESDSSNSVASESLSFHRSLPKSLPLDIQSFIFNPDASPLEFFQNCTTPRNETGRCRYLQHCMIPSIISSFNQFLGYVCIINERFIGVCCPNQPATVLVVQDEKDQTGNEISLNSECGISTRTRIVGGSNADPKAWPWMVALLKKRRNAFFCGGALINDRYVLTAAHCTFNIPNNEIIARVGEYDFKDNGNLHNDYDVIEIKRHAHYNRRNLRNDVALLKLEKAVVLNEFIKTICFPEGERSYVGENATLAGWGNLRGSVLTGGATSDILQEASFPVVTNEECTTAHRVFIPQSLICTSSAANDKGACNGDSGGPLMLLDKNDRWKIIGIVSWGRRGCSPEFPTVYTRVSHFLEWIKKHAKV